MQIFYTCVSNALQNESKPDSLETTNFLFNNR